MSDAAVDAGLLAALDLRHHIGDQRLVVEATQRREQPDRFETRRLVGDLKASLQAVGHIGQFGDRLLFGCFGLGVARRTHGFAQIEIGIVHGGIDL